MHNYLLGFDLARVLVPNYVVLVLFNEGGGPHHMLGQSYMGPMDWFEEASGFDFEYSSNIQLRFFSFCIIMFSPHAYTHTYTHTIPPT